MRFLRMAANVLGKFLIWLLVTLLILTGGIYGMMYILVNGPSPSAGVLFIRSVRETSAVYWLADLFCTPEEIAQIEKREENRQERTDVSLVTIKPAAEAADLEGSDLALSDDASREIAVETVTGSGFVGYMMVVQDPGRLMMGTPAQFGGSGLSVEAMCARYGCVAGINGGAFVDTNGTGTGGIPEGMTVVDGEVRFAAEGCVYPFVGFDGEHILHTGKMTPADVRERNIRFGCSFGPVLISNGKRTEEDALVSGVNPRTAIGQRADGAVLLLVIDGRQPYSLGATYGDLADIMQTYGAVNACNLDGGSSTAMWYNGDYVNHSAWVSDSRPTATAFLVKEVR